MKQTIRCVSPWKNRLKGAFCLFPLGLVLMTAQVQAAQRKVDATIAVKQEYSDNLFFDATNIESDWITTISPGLELINKHSTNAGGSQTSA